MATTSTQRAQTLKLLGARSMMRLRDFAAHGIGPETLRTAAADPQFLSSVLDFVMRDDATVKAFASASQLHPTNIAAAREVLGDPKWERDVP